MIGLPHKQGSREWVDNNKRMTSGTALSLCSLEFLSKKAFLLVGTLLRPRNNTDKKVRFVVQVYRDINSASASQYEKQIKKHTHDRDNDIK